MLTDRPMNQVNTQRLWWRYRDTADNTCIAFLCLHWDAIGLSWLSKMHSFHLYDSTVALLYIYFQTQANCNKICVQFGDSKSRRDTSTSKAHENRLKIPCH